MAVPSAVYTMYGPSFASVGADGSALIKDMNYGATETGDTLLLIDPVSAAYTELTYLNSADAKEYGGNEAVAGWYIVNDDDTVVYKGNESVSLGCAFWLYAGNGATSVTDAGEVKSSFTRTLPAALYSAFANPFPTTVTLKSFTYSATETGDTMLLIDPATAAYTELPYLNSADAKEYGGNEAVAGWYIVNDDDTVVYKGNEEFAPGQGCWIYPGNGTVTISGNL